MKLSNLSLKCGDMVEGNGRHNSIFTVDNLQPFVSSLCVNQSLGAEIQELLHGFFSRQLQKVRHSL